MKLILLLSLITISINQAFSCTCQEINTESVEEFYQNAKAVFIGANSNKSQPIESEDDFFKYVTTEFIVGINFKEKNNREPVQLVSMESDGANCGITFEKEYSGYYLIFANETNQGLEINHCSILKLDLEKLPEDLLIHLLNKIE